MGLNDAEGGTDIDVVTAIAKRRRSLKSQLSSVLAPQWLNERPDNVWSAEALTSYRYGSRLTCSEFTWTLHSRLPYPPSPLTLLLYVARPVT